MQLQQAQGHVEPTHQQGLSVYGLNIVSFVVIYTSKGECRYNYYNWRKDTTNDLQLIFALNASLIMGGAAIKWTLIDPLSGQGEAVRLVGGARLEQVWSDVYKCASLSYCSMCRTNRTVEAHL